MTRHLDAESSSPIFRIGVFALIFDNERRILLGHRRDIDWWNLPGGGMEAGETVDEALAKPRHIVDNHPRKQDGYRIKIGGKCISSDPQSLKRDRTTSGKRIDYKGPTAILAPAKGAISRFREDSAA